MRFRNSTCFEIGNAFLFSLLVREADDERKIYILILFPNLGMAQPIDLKAVLADETSELLKIAYGGFSARTVVLSLNAERLFSIKCSLSPELQSQACTNGHHL